MTKHATRSTKRRRFLHRQALGALMIAAALATPVRADTTVQTVPYASLSDLKGVYDFDGFFYRSAPPLNESMVITDATGIRFTATLRDLPRHAIVLPRILGQGRHYAVPDSGPTDMANANLNVEGTIATIMHDGLNSRAIIPVGPDGADVASGQGEGTLAMHFDVDQTRFGFRVYCDPADGKSTRLPRLMTVQMYDRTGQMTAREGVALRPGTTDVAFRTPSGVAAILISNKVPGGIAIDDILFQPAF